MNFLGLDIGGAAVKASDGIASACTVPFPLWKEPARVYEILAELVHTFQPDQIAVTMTGELCDCFETKQHGVSFLLGALQRAASVRIPIHVWNTDAAFVEVQTANQFPEKVAAANWLALATAAAKEMSTANGLLIDIGSTTTDIITLSNGRATPTGLTDSQRLSTGELVYVGVGRTPICALLRSFEYENVSYRIMNEFFASSVDAYVLTGEIAESSSRSHTADGRPATKAFAFDRLARMCGFDRTTFTEAMAIAMAVQIRDETIQRIRSGVHQVIAQARISNPPQMIASGQGEFLIRDMVSDHEMLCKAPYASLSEIWSPECSQAACAHAVAKLLRSQLQR